MGELIEAIPPWVWWLIVAPLIFLIVVRVIYLALIGFGPQYVKEEKQYEY